MRKFLFITFCSWVLSLNAFCQEAHPGLTRDLEIFNSFYTLLLDQYVDPVHSPGLMQAGINAFLKLLDPFNVYTDSADISARRNAWKGILYSGIGVNILHRDSFVVVTQITEGYPAMKAGLRVGDKLLSAGGISLKNKPLTEITPLLKGAEGSTLQLVVDRPGIGQKNFTLSRERIFSKSITWYGMIDDSTGYIRCSQFLENSYDTLLSAFHSLKKHAQLKRLVLDFRDNIGGLVQEAVNAVNIFLPKGKIVCSLQSKNNAGGNYNYTTTSEALDTLIPLVILVNHNTISAGEIFTGAMQDYDRAVIIGERTYGKGYVQGTHNLAHGAQLYVTSARYYTPSGRCLQAMDLTHKYIDGKVNLISDSLKQVFYTRHHRPVHSNGGVEPDIPVPAENTTNEMLTALQNCNLPGDFATLYRNARALEPGYRFSLSPRDYKAFEIYAAPYVKTMQLADELQLKSLIDKAKARADKKLARSLEKALLQAQKVKMEAFYQSKSHIKSLLEKEIIIRYYHLSGEVRYSFLHDVYLLKAINVLNNRAVFRSILHL